MLRRRRLPGPTVALLLPPAALAVHQLRFALAFGGGAGIELRRTGHDYLHSLAPWLVLLIALAAGSFLRRAGRALSGHTSPSRFTVSLAALWALCSATLLAIYVAQELLEALLAAGHPAGLAGVFAYGGWWSLPAAACVGLVLAVALHGARWALGEIARLAARRRCVRRRIALPPRRRAMPRLAPAPLVAGWSGRGPPA
jgi:hypothetical protein